MKKLNSKIALMQVALLAMTFTACSSDDDDNAPITDPAAAEISSEDMMQKLTDTSSSFMAKINSADFNNVARITNALDDVNGGAVDDWAGDCLDDITTVINDSYSDGGYYDERDASRLWRASNFKGHFRAQNGSWIKESGNYDDLQFTMTDANGKTCIARLATSGKETEVHASFFDNSDYEYDYSSDYWRYIETNYNNRWMIPANIRVVISQDGTQIASVDLATSFSGEGELISQASANIVSSVKLNNYQVDVRKASATDRSADVDVAVAVDGQTILHATGTAAGSYTVDKDGDPNVTLGTASATFDVMGEAQVYFQTTNLSTYQSLISDFDDSDRMSKTDAQSLADQINKLSTVRLCFNNNTVESATAYFSPYLQYGEESDGYWELLPVLKFTADGKEVAFEDYFTEENFKSVSDTYNRLVDSFERMFNF